MRYYGKIHSKLPIFRVKSEKNLHLPEKFTLTASAASATIIWYGSEPFQQSTCGNSLQQRLKCRRPKRSPRPSEPMVTSCYTPLYPRHALFLRRYTLKYFLYTLLNPQYTLLNLVTHCYTLLDTVTFMLHPGRGVASKSLCPCSSQIFFSSTKLWILRSTCKVHLVKF